MTFLQQIMWALDFFVSASVRSVFWYCRIGIMNVQELCGHTAVYVSKSLRKKKNKQNNQTQNSRKSIVQQNKCLSAPQN